MSKMSQAKNSQASVRRHLPLVVTTTELALKRPKMGSIVPKLGP